MPRRGRSASRRCFWTLQHAFVRREITPKILQFRNTCQTEGYAMAKYLITASYNAEGLKGLYKEKASNRMAAFVRTIEGLGGKLESGYFALGEHDVVAIVDLPDNIAASAVSLTASSTGLLRTQTTALLTPEEVDKAFSTSVGYRGPGT